MAYSLKKEQALILRKEGKSITFIAKYLNVSKSTVSLWCKDMVLTTQQIEALLLTQKTAGLKALFNVNEKKRKERLVTDKIIAQKGADDIGKMTDRDLFLLGLGLYWGEGYKYKHGGLGFTNSDPRMITVFLKWLESVYGISKENISLRISINAIHKERLEEIQLFWSKHTKIPLSQFTKVSFIKSFSKKVYKDNENYFGVLRVRVRQGSEYRKRLLGSLNAICEEIEKR